MTRTEEPSQPLARRIVRFQVDPGEGIRRAFRATAIARPVTPSCHGKRSAGDTVAPSEHQTRTGPAPDKVPTTTRLDRRATHSTPMLHRMVVLPEGGRHIARIVCRRCRWCAELPEAALKGLRGARLFRALKCTACGARDAEV